MQTKFSMINGQIVAVADAKVHISDMSIQRGYGIFDYLRVVNGRPLFLNDHLDRFERSALTMHLDHGFARHKLEQMIYELMEANQLTYSGIRLSLTGGYTEDGYSIGTPNLLITQNYYRYSPDIFQKGIRLLTHHYQRQLPYVKTIDYLEAVRMQPELKSKNFDELLYHSAGMVTECPRANIFLVMPDGSILTPDTNVLGGITRKRLLELEHFKIEATTVSTELLSQASEIFISSTTKIVLPVVQIDGKIIGKGNDFPKTREILESLISLEQQQ